MKTGPKTMAKKPTKDFVHKGVHFRVVFSHPKSRASSGKPCRALITPRDPKTGKLVLKSQLYVGRSDQPVNYSVYGSNEQDIWEHELEDVANRLIALMAEKGLLPSGHSVEEDLSETADLGEVAASFKDVFFALHRSEWTERTKQEYGRQYDVLVSELTGLPIKKLDTEAYRALQNTICLNSLKTARKMTEWTYGDEPPSSAGKRMAILYMLIQDLKQVEALPIPVIPARYNSKPSRQDLLLSRTDSARSLPVGLLREACHASPLLGQAGIMADAGLRISEAAGLLFSSVQSVETSQGLMHYIEVNGQLGPSGKRTEITKTDASYRVIPLSSEEGTTLLSHQCELEQTYGDISLRLMSAQVKDGELIDDASNSNSWRNTTEAEISKLLQGPLFFEALKSERVYTFNEIAQDTELKSMLTPHALRRNFCTWLYCKSGLDTPEIYRQMGHTDKNQPKRTATGLTPEELRLMCLHKYVSPTLHHPANPLRYSADGAIHATKVPTCEVVLTLPPCSKIELLVKGTEPGNIVHLAGEGLDIHLLHESAQEDVRYTYALLTNEDETAIVKKHKLFE